MRAEKMKRLFGWQLQYESKPFLFSTVHMGGHGRFSAAFWPQGPQFDSGSAKNWVRLFDCVTFFLPKLT